MKSILKKVAGVAVAAVLALGMFSCSNGIDYPVKQTVATPAFSVAEGAKIYYTTDDSDPTASSTEYKAAISVVEAVTLKAIAIKDGMNDSAVASASYTIKGNGSNPSIQCCFRCSRQRNKCNNQLCNRRSKDLLHNRRN